MASVAFFTNLKIHWDFASHYPAFLKEFSYFRGLKNRYGLE